MFRPVGTKSARVIRVIETKADRGLGIEKDPVREVTQYWDLEGNFLAAVDNDKQYLCDLSMWESERLRKIIQEEREMRKPIYQIPKPPKFIRDEDPIRGIADEICELLKGKRINYVKANEALYLADKALRKNAYTQAFNEKGE